MVASLGLVGLMGSLLAAAPLTASAAPGDEITGTIWQDYDADGVLDAFEDKGRLAGIEVRAFDSAGTVVGPVLTGEDGTYALPVTSDASRWRVEANVPQTPQWQEWRSSAAGRGVPGANGTTVQHVDIADADDVNFSFHVPGAFVENNPLVYVPELRFGTIDGPSAAMTAGGVMAYDAESTCNTCIVPRTAMVDWSEIGATMGTAWQLAPEPNELGSLLAAAYYRRHAAFGPGGIGAIYQITPEGDDWSAETASAEVYVDVTEYGIDVGQVSDADAVSGDPNGLRPSTTDENPAYDWMRDAQGWTRVGRTGLGGMAFSADQQTLFAVNLHNRSLIKVETGQPLTPEPTVEEIELPGYITENPDLRPFGLTANPLTNELYLSVTNTAESTGDPADLHAYVYSFFADAPDELTLVLDFSLDIDRGFWNPAHPVTATSYIPWTTDSSKLVDRSGYHFSPMPVLQTATNLHGNLVLGVRSIFGDLVGAGGTFLDATTNRRVTEVASPGAVYMASPNGDGTWTIEDDGVVGGVTGAGAGKDPGPGGSAFFDQSWNSNAHQNEALGSLVVIPSREDGILTTGIHTGNGTYQSGFRRLYQDTGEHYLPRGAVIAQHTKPLANGTMPQITSKGNGLGAAAALASTAPIEIGNYVWYDTDHDGVQDPDEAPVVGATVNLYEVSDGVRTLVSSTTTDERGEYYFSSDDAGYPLRTNTDYVVGIDEPADYAPGGPLENWFPTVADTGDADAVDPDRNDSDGIVSGGYPYVSLTTGGPGQNNHTFDFGFARIDYAFDKRTVSGPTENPDDDGTWVVEYELLAENTGMVDGAYRLTDDLTGYGRGIVVRDTEVVSGPEGAELNPEWDGDVDQRVVLDEVPIAAQTTGDDAHVYRLRVTVALATYDDGAAAAPAEQLQCAPGQGEDETTGLFNRAVLDPSNHAELVDDECDELPLVTLDKTVVAEPSVVDPVGQPGVWEVGYGLTVTNETDVATDYDLVDELRLGAGIDVVDGSVVAANVVPGDITTNPDYDGVADLTVVTDQPIAGGASHEYTVTVRYTVDLPVADGAVDPSDCSLVTDEERGTGLYNDATATFNGYPSLDSECREVGRPTHTKELVSAEPIGDGQWEAVYELTVSNLGAGETRYDLDDALRLGEDVTLLSAEVVGSPDGVALAEPAWDGGEATRVATDVALRGSDDEGYAPHVYRLRVVAEVPLQPTGSDGDPTVCAVVDGEPLARALTNTSTLTDESGLTEDDSACAPLPAITIAKDVAAGPVANGDGTWTVSYDVVAHNSGGGDGSYDVVDAMTASGDLVVEGTAVTAAPSGVTVLETWTGLGPDGAVENVVATDVPLASGEIHTYEVQVLLSLPAGSSSVATECSALGEGDAAGLLNTVVLTHNDLSDEDSACVTVEEPPVEEPPVEEPPVETPSEEPEPPTEPSDPETPSVPDEDLPRTGAPVLAGVLAALALLAVGGVVLAARRA